MIRLVVNADDLGLDPAIDRGIFDAAERGIVTSASVLVTGRTFEALRPRLRDPPFGVGVHLAAVGGLVPAASPEAVPHLLEGGRLRRSWRSLVALLWRRPRIAGEVLAEFEAQLARARDAGVAVDHVDAHQHLHVWPSLFDGVVALCRRFGIRAVRIPDERPSARCLLRPRRAAAVVALLGLAARARRRADGLVAPRFWGLFDGGALDRRALAAILERLRDGDHELGCHPGHGVQGVPEDPDWRYRWDAERIALCDPEARRIVERRAIRLVRCGDLANT